MEGQRVYIRSHITKYLKPKARGALEMPLSVLAVGENKMTIESNNKAHHKDTQKERIKKKKKIQKPKLTR